MTSRFLKRPLSYSQLSAWEFSPEEWYSSYVLGIRNPPNPAMSFGSALGDLLGTPDSPIPELSEQGIKEYRLTAKMEGIHMVGYCDGYCPDTLTLHENKTSATTNRWTQGKADKHKQIDMYLLLLYLQDGVPPERVTCYLNFIETKATGLGYRLHDPVQWQQFLVKPKTMSDLDAFTEYMLATVEDMQRYIDQQRLSTPAPTRPAFKGVY